MKFLTLRRTCLIQLLCLVGHVYLSDMGASTVKWISFMILAYVPVKVIQNYTLILFFVKK